MAQTDRVLTWLRKAVLIAALTLLCFLCIIAGLVIFVLMKQKAALHEQTDRVAAGVTKLETTAAKLTDPKRVTDAVRQGVGHLPVNLPTPSAANAAVQQEIAFLLQCIGRPELRYEYEGKDRPAEWVQMKLNGKAVLLHSEFVSAEEFIDKVATKTGDGSVYRVVDKEGGKTELAVWLRGRLQKYRSGQGGTTEQK